MTTPKKKAAPKRSAPKKSAAPKKAKAPTLEEQLQTAMAAGDVKKVLAISAELQAKPAPKGRKPVIVVDNPDYDEDDETFLEDDPDDDSIIDIDDYEPDVSEDGEYDSKQAGWMAPVRKKGGKVGGNPNRNYGTRQSMKGLVHKNTYKAPARLDKVVAGGAAAQIDKANRKLPPPESRPRAKKVRVRCRGKCNRQFVVYVSQLQMAPVDEHGRMAHFYECDRCIVRRGG